MGFFACRDTCLSQNYVIIGRLRILVVTDSKSVLLRSVCFVLMSVRFLIFSLSRLSCSFPPEVLSRISLSPFAFCYPFLRCSSLGIVRLSSALFLCFIIFHIIMYAHVCGVEMLQVCKFASLPSVFLFVFLFFVCLFFHSSVFRLRACEYYNVSVFSSSVLTL